MREAAMFLVVAIMLVFDLTYSYQIWKRKIDPTLSTWIIFLAGTGLSLITYGFAERHDYKSGVLNTFDVVSVMIILSAILKWGKQELRFRAHEKWYLVGVGCIVGYGIMTGDVWSSNLYTQALICCGYIPLIQTLVTEKRNTESFFGWICGLSAGIVGLYPAIVSGNTLAVIYAVRTIGAVSIILCMMTYYQYVKTPSPNR